MSDQPEQQPADEPQAVTGAVREFHVGEVRQFIGDLAARVQLRSPKARPPFGTDDEGTPRPDPALASVEEKAPEPRASRAGPGPAEPRADPKR